MSKFNWKSASVGLAIGALLFAGAPVIADVGDAVLQGQGNRVDARTTLRGAADTVTLRLINESAGDPGLAIVTEAGTPPLKVNRKAKVVNLNADLLDGRNSGSFQSKVARGGDTLIGSFAMSGPPQWLSHAESFEVTLPSEIPVNNLHFIGEGEATTTSCPGAYQAAAGHLCVYSYFQNMVTFLNFYNVAVPSANGFLGGSEHGFVMIWEALGTTSNVRGTWAYTVPSVAPEASPAPPASTPNTELGS